MPKNARLNGIKGFHCYTIDEAAEITGVSSRTIRNWCKNGLYLMDSARPFFIRGDDLRAYIKAQRAGRKIKTGLAEIYCTSCRRPRQPADGLADCDIYGSRVRLTALCETCGTLMFKPVAEIRIPDLARVLDLKITRHETTL
ncbi:MAG: helix-turn-helix domain-containing protein [Pseudomonadota bacterium]